MHQSKGESASQTRPDRHARRLRRSVWVVATLCALALLGAACATADQPVGIEEAGESEDATVSAGGETDGEATEPSEAGSDAGGSDSDSQTDSADNPNETGDDTTAANPVAPDVDRLPQLNLTLTTVGSFELPVAMAIRPGSDNLYIAEQTGDIRILEPPEGPSDTNGKRLINLDDLAVMEGSEQGLLGIAFSPDGRRLYASYTDSDGTSRVDEFSIDETTTSERIDESSRRNIITVEQPFVNHNGGDLRFGPDGFLYIAFGDGGAAGDPLGSGQDLSTLLGSILRIDPDVAVDPNNPEVSADSPYDIPDDNPFVDREGAAPEIWLYGVRNPWRFSFDAETGDLWIGDVGQNEFEEINLLPADEGLGRGANLGWKEMEGDSPYEGGTAPEDHQGPVFTYGHDDGCSVTGGVVYRGQAIPLLDGMYLYGDFCADTISAIRIGADSEVAEAGPVPGLKTPPRTVAGFAEGPDGEVYLLSYDGALRRIDPTAATINP